MKRWIILSAILFASLIASVLVYGAGVSYTDIPGRGDGVLLYYQNTDGTYELVTSDTPLKVDAGVDSPLAVDVRTMPSSAKTDSPLSVNVLNESGKTDSPLAVNVLTLPAISGTVGLSSNTVVDTGALSDTLQQDSVIFNPYTEVSKTWTNVKKVEIYNAGKGLRWANVSGNCATTYWVVPSSSPGYTMDGLKFSTITIYFKGDSTATDSGTAMFNVWK